MPTSLPASVCLSCSISSDILSNSVGKLLLPLNNTPHPLPGVNDSKETTTRPKRRRHPHYCSWSKTGWFFRRESGTRLTLRLRVDLVRGARKRGPRKLDQSREMVAPEVCSFF